MPLLQEAARVGFLADFQELPLDLRTLVIRQMVSIVTRCHRDLVTELHMQRAWFELDIDDIAVMDAYIIE